MIASTFARPSLSSYERSHENVKSDRSEESRAGFGSSIYIRDQSPAESKLLDNLFWEGVCSESQNAFHGFLAKYIASPLPGLLEITADFQSEGTTLNFRIFLYFFSNFFFISHGRDRRILIC